MELIEVVKVDQNDDTEFVTKFPSENLKLGCQVVVNESQDAIFVKSGEVLDVLGPGTHTLTTGNIPILEKLINFPFGGNTPFTAEVWYVNKTVKRNLKWGTPAPVPLMDMSLGFPINLRGFGKWGARIENSKSFLTQIVGSQSSADSTKIYEYFIGEIIQKLINTVSQSISSDRISILQISASANDLAETVFTEISTEFRRFGIEVINFNIESLNIPDDDMKQIQDVFAKTMEARELSNVEIGGAYATIKSFDVLNEAASNPGDGSGVGAMLGAGIGLGAGLPIGNQLGQNMNIGNTNQTTSDPKAKLRQLKDLLDEGLINEEEFNEKKSKILEDL